MASYSLQGRELWRRDDIPLQLFLSQLHRWCPQSCSTAGKESRKVGGSTPAITASSAAVTSIVRWFYYSLENVDRSGLSHSYLRLLWFSVVSIHVSWRAMIRVSSGGWRHCNSLAGETMLLEFRKLVWYHFWLVREYGRWMCVLQEGLQHVPRVTARLGGDERKFFKEVYSNYTDGNYCSPSTRSSMIFFFSVLFFTQWPWW